MLEALWWWLCENKLVWMVGVSKQMLLYCCHERQDTTSCKPHSWPGWIQWYLSKTHWLRFCWNRRLLERSVWKVRQQYCNLETIKLAERSQLTPILKSSEWNRESSYSDWDIYSQHLSLDLISATNGLRRHLRVVYHVTVSAAAGRVWKKDTSSVKTSQTPALSPNHSAMD